MEYEEERFLEVSRTEQQTTERSGILIPCLPHEIAILCIARVPRAYHVNISAVCRSWRNLLHGRVFWKLRQELSLAEEWIYLWSETAAGNVWRCFDPSLKKWWKLPGMPQDNRIPGHSAFASIYGKIFVIGGYLLNFYNTDKCYIPCRTVTYFDARSYSWKRAADLNIARAECMVGIIDNQLYAFGGSIEGHKNTTITTEVYDPMTDTWRLISSMKYPMKMRDGVVMGGKFYAVDSECELRGVVYDPQTDMWEEMADGLNDGWGLKTTVLDGKLYTMGHQYVARPLEDGYEPDDEEQLQAYNPITDIWEMVDERWSGMMLRRGQVELISFGGKLCIISVGIDGFDFNNEAVIICMVILKAEGAIENHRCFVDFRDEFEIELLDEPLSMPQEIKRCQVVAL